MNEPLYWMSHAIRKKTRDGKSVHPKPRPDSELLDFVVRLEVQDRDLMLGFADLVKHVRRW